MRKREANEDDHATLDEAINVLWEGVKKRPGDPEGYPMLDETVNAIKEQRKHANFMRKPDDPKKYPMLPRPSTR